MILTRIKYFAKNPLQLISVGLGKMIPKYRFFTETVNSSNPITFKNWFIQKVVGYNKEAYWPMHPSSKVVGVENIIAGIDTDPGINPGCYIQGSGRLYIGDYSRIGANCGLLSGNHDLYDHRIRTQLTTIIGKYCWVGMNSIILPGVELGDFTKVAAGSVVTKSFKEGYCVIGGNPAKIIKYLEKDKCVRHRNKIEYNGYIKSSQFELFRQKKLNL
jgi:acetyltransferase-like isoleucine patch superfamily enzyme